jgi:hypothetical protein
MQASAWHAACRHRPAENGELVMVIDEPAHVSLMPGAPAATCDLCTAESALASTMVVVQHARGGSVHMAACDWCVQTIRRLSAVTGGKAVFVVGGGVSVATSSVVGAGRGARRAAATRLPILVLELAEHVQDTAGLHYVVRIYGQVRTDGRWEGWLNFVGVGSAVAFQTGVETTQRTLDDLVFWAKGLEPTYLRGAFERAQRLTTIPG